MAFWTWWKLQTRDTSTKLLLPVKNIALAFPKTPPMGTSPSKLLKEIFRYTKKVKFYIAFGILPDKLFWERSRWIRHFIDDKDDGTFPQKKFLCRQRNSRLEQSPMVLGISPDKLYTERSSQ